MATIGRLWAGRLYGTNTGNLFAELESVGDRLRGSIRLLDANFGLAVYDVAGTYDGKLSLTGTPAQIAEGAEYGDIKAEATLTSSGSLRGTWESSIGTAGTFELHPHDIEQTSQSDSQLPEQFYTSNIELGALRLYSDDIRTLITHIKQDFLSGRPVVTYVVRGNEATIYADDFLKDLDAVGELRYLKITIQEPEAHGINKLVVVELGGFAKNVVRVQGIRESWVVGKAEAIARELRQSEKSLVTTYRRFGLNIGQFIFIAMLILLPDIQSLSQRTAFIAFVFALILLLGGIHNRYIPNVAIYCGPKKPSLIGRAWPSILSWLGAVTASLAAALVYYWLTRGAG